MGARRVEREPRGRVLEGSMSVDETPREAAPEQPAVLDVDVVGDRMLASVEKGDVSVVVEAPVGTSEDELKATLDDVPERIERTAELFAGGDE